MKQRTEMATKMLQDLKSRQAKNLAPSLKKAKWTDFILSLGMELAFGDRPEKVYKKLENTLSRMEYITKGDF